MRCTGTFAGPGTALGSDRHVYRAWWARADLVTTWNGSPAQHSGEKAVQNGNIGFQEAARMELLPAWHRRPLAPTTFGSCGS